LGGVVESGEVQVSEAAHRASHVCWGWDIKHFNVFSLGLRNTG